ncbi:putative methyltransferase NSUN7 [Pangasianodon hypophthalmus]|uniref:putative methyltransferase NSUN7 n=1 Tax=Pangasianodon hypophthalmus TaxID=310915 RepID=UPI0023073241|nr:putative methyltransferase NSUN7 [Pangasianodon hypophthalmus]
MSTQGFPDCVYAQAADTYRASCVEKTQDYRAIRYAPVPHPAAGDTVNKRNTKQNELWAYELAFNTLKFQALLEDVLIDSCFQASQQLPDDLMALAMVMLYDLQDRKFQPREPMTGEGEGPVEEVRLMEDSLFRFRTKLAASLARFRIKQDLVCIDDILPKSVKEKHQRKHKLPTCAWVNTLKSSLDEVCVTLETLGFVQVDPHTHLEGSVFCKDTHCPDVLLFPHQARELLDKTTLLMDHTLIIQEKSRSLAVYALRPLLAKNTDILIAGSFSAHTVAHVGVQASVFSNVVYACGLPADSAHREELQATLSSIGCKNVRLLSEQFAELSESDSRLQKVGVVLVLPRCTASALTDPIAHIINEDGDRKLLHDLSQGAVSDTKLESLTKKQIQDLSHALTFPKVHGVVYCTCSVYAQENELVVKRALKNAAVTSKLRPFRVVSTGCTDEEKFLRLQASGTGDGCFLCVLKREEAETVQDILVRAAAKGLLNGLALPEKVKKTRTKEKQRGAPAPAPPQPDPSLFTDPSVSQQLHTDTTAAGGALDHTRDSRCPSPALNDNSAAHVEASKATNQQKKGRRRKSRALKYSRRVKTKTRATHKRRTRSSRKKPPRVQPA